MLNRYTRFCVKSYLFISEKTLPLYDFTELFKENKTIYGKNHRVRA